MSIEWQDFFDMYKILLPQFPEFLLKTTGTVGTVGTLQSK